MGKSEYLKHYLKRIKANNTPEYLPTLGLLEEEYINYLLELTGYDLNNTADILNIQPALLFNRMKKYDIWL